MIARVHERRGATVWAQVELYKVVAHPELLYGSNSWVVTEEILKVLTAFHHQAALWITKMTDKLGSEEER